MKRTTTKIVLQDKVAVGYVDEEGKEQGFPVFIQTKRKPYNNGWVMMSQDALEQLLSEDLKLSDTKVLLKLLALLDYENYLLFSNKSAAKELGMSESTFSRSLRRLVESDLILKGERIGNHFSYRLNPDFGWKGRVYNLEQYRQNKEGL